MSKIYNFSAGPAMLPPGVLKNIQEELLCYKNTKASIMEISHRGEAFTALAEQMQQDLRELMAIPEDYAVLFLQGGASSQFSMVPMNLARNKATNYAVTGFWSKRAMLEADRLGEVNVCTNNSTNNATDIQDLDKWRIDENAAYLHYVANETIEGLEFDYIPEVTMPLVADMSSTILSRPVDVKKFGLIYASSQKNLGAAGLTLVIIKKSLLGNTMEKSPYLFSYKMQYENQSMSNTPDTFSWYVVSKVLEWLKEQGGPDAIAEINKRKAGKLYQAIDGSDFYHNAVTKRYRSTMNVPFTLADETLNERFLQEAERGDLLALKGHKAVGGMRASIYNAMPEEGIDALVSFMQLFEQKYG